MEHGTTPVPAGPALGILLRGIGAGGVLGLIAGLIVGLTDRAPGWGWLVFTPLFGMAVGLVAGFTCAVTGLALHTIAERFLPVLRAPAAAAGAAAVVILAWRAIIGNLEVEYMWPVLLLAAIAAALAIWLTRPLRRSTRPPQ
ncbi:hypothetical protein E2F48_04025 [Arthrobacter crusticola]|uniref:Uncharacterized protein n=1 Tax=Arthrobacter crusticola TaxID=2547960 RepID=A0A4R5TYQ5_9MICC|nr:hypothetical protein [Arthrobacter crusticola]TDK26377.1 hypothetical protein E2F48_04025 [Arthrobacter crusticola]